MGIAKILSSNFCARVSNMAAALSGSKSKQKKRNKPHDRDVDDVTPSSLAPSLTANDDTKSKEWCGNYSQQKKAKSQRRSKHGTQNMAAECMTHSARSHKSRKNDFLLKDSIIELNDAPTGKRIRPSTPVKICKSKEKSGKNRATHEEDWRLVDYTNWYGLSGAEIDAEYKGRHRSKREKNRESKPESNGQPSSQPAGEKSTKSDFKKPTKESSSNCIKTCPTGNIDARLNIKKVVKKVRFSKKVECRYFNPDDDYDPAEALAKHNRDKKNRSLSNNRNMKLSHHHRCRRHYSSCESNNVLNSESITGGESGDEADDDESLLSKPHVQKKTAELKGILKAVTKNWDSIK